MTKRETICEMGYEDAVVFDSPDFDAAIIGVSEEGKIVYDYETIRALPYAGEHAPVIMYRLWE